MKFIFHVTFFSQEFMSKILAYLVLYTENPILFEIGLQYEILTSIRNLGTIKMNKKREETHQKKTLYSSNRFDVGIHFEVVQSGER